MYTSSPVLLLILFFLSSGLIASEKKTVLFDESHGQLFRAGKTGELDLSKLSYIFQAEGWSVKTSDSAITDKVLEGVDALVISGAFKSISSSEMEAILRFVGKGGKLSIMLHIGIPFSELLYAMNVDVSNGVIHEKENIDQNNDLEFNVLNLKKHPLTNKLNRFTMYGAWALMPTKEDAQIIAQTSEKAWIDLNGDRIADAQQSFATVIAGTVGAGHFVVFSDDAIFQNKFLKGDNYILGENLAKWLKE